jgi:hypothetical protein
MKMVSSPGIQKQGQHVDPLDPWTPKPNPRDWSPLRRQAFASPEMEEFARALHLGEETDARRAALDDLSTFFGLDVDTCLNRCINWEDWSVEEWQAERRDSADSLSRFYRTTKSWAFDLLWYAYLQAKGYGYPLSVAIALSVPASARGGRHLDFGSGVGVTSQLFQRLGYESDLADISTSLLAFAKFRLDRRSQPATYIDLT